MDNSINLLRREFQPGIASESSLGKEPLAVRTAVHRAVGVAVLLVDFEVFTFTERAVDFHGPLLDFPARRSPKSLWVSWCGLSPRRGIWPRCQFTLMTGLLILKLLLQNQLASEYDRRQ